jgi:hypothetical protein
MGDGLGTPGDVGFSSFAVVSIHVPVKEFYAAKLTLARPHAQLASEHSRFLFGNDNLMLN